jgi:threonine/homoserine/homoserine lactone efflux protein
MNYSLLAAYCLTVLALVATPGPVVMLVTGTAVREGAACAIRTMFGSHLASLLLIAFAAMMLYGLVAVDPLALMLLALGGSVYIVVLGLAMWRDEETMSEAKKTRGGVGKGFVTALSNPKDILFFAAFFPQFVPVTGEFGLSLGLLTLLWAAIDLGVLSLYILAIDRWLQPARARLLTKVSALLLLAMALYGFGYNFWQLLQRWGT